MRLFFSITYWDMDSQIWVAVFISIIVIIIGNVAYNVILSGGDILKILYLGSVIKTADCTKYLGPSVAGNKMQLGILKGLNELHKDIAVVTEIPIAAYPKEKKIIIKSGKIKVTHDIQAKVVPFVNIFVLKQFTMIASAFFMLLKWGIANRKEQKTIITFNPFPYISIPTLLASKLFNIKTLCIFADPPIDAVKRSLIGEVAKYFENISTKKNIKKYDGLVVLNIKAIDKYSPNTKYVLVDGGFDTNDKPSNQPGGQWLGYSEGDTIDIIFSGGLYEYNGLVNLIEAFKTLKNQSLRLCIYGEGPLKEFIVAASEEDYRIIYYGNVSNDEMIVIQQNSGILINPRPVNESISLYTFPSKMIEYMLSGTPIITTKLNGLTEEYLKNVFVLEDDSIIEIANGIELFLELEKEQIMEKAKKAREFIVNNKTWEIQAKKVYEFIVNEL